ncbi:hypothetical protein C8R46DRAFT_1198678 [Mycena filopes]|nr:hypothetical protein C8R46DRAFT_1198678 [Mycena filopes]
MRRSPRFVFAPHGLGIFWDVNGVHLAESEFADDSVVCEPKIIQEISFEGEEVLDVAVHDDNLAILTGIAAGGQWRRRLQRREDLHDDPWTEDHPLYSYGVRVFSLQSRSQIGSPMWLPDVGVDASIRAGTDAVIVLMTGPTCYASFWRIPRRSDDIWHCFHRELTWDPDEIAKYLGFSNHEEELAHSESTDDPAPNYDPDEPDGSRWRTDVEDTELTDYAFTSDTRAVRLRDTDGAFTLEAIDLSGMNTEAVGWTVAPVLREVPLYTDLHGGLLVPQGYISAPTIFSDDDYISTFLVFLNGVSETFWRVSDLCKPGTKIPFVDREDQDEFNVQRVHGLGPTFFGRQTVFPDIDLVPHSSSAGIPTVRFFTFPDAHVDILLMQLLPAEFALLSSEPAQYLSILLGRYAVFWNGSDTVCITYRNERSPPEVQEPPRQWFIKLTQDILEQLRVSLVTEAASVDEFLLREASTGRTD